MQGHELSDELLDTVSGGSRSLSLKDQQAAFAQAVESSVQKMMTSTGQSALSGEDLKALQRQEAMKQMQKYMNQAK